MLRALRADFLVIKQSRIDSLYGLTNLMDEALAGVAQLQLPTLILYGMRDEVMPRRPFCRMAANLADGPGRAWRLALYPDGYHMLARDLRAALVLTDIAAWILDRAQRLPSGYEYLADGRPAIAWCGVPRP
jgi:alpha-beta hydrolase superfamily lysophospholipase